MNSGTVIVQTIEGDADENSVLLSIEKTLLQAVGLGRGDTVDTQVVETGLDFNFLVITARVGSDEGRIEELIGDEDEQHAFIAVPRPVIGTAANSDELTAFTVGGAVARLVLVVPISGGDASQAPPVIASSTVS